MLSAILLATLAQASPPASAPEPAPAAQAAPVPEPAAAEQPTPAPQPAPLPAGAGIALFQRMCVGTLPDPGAFARELAGTGVAWTPHEHADREPGVGGNYWRAAQGQIAYLYRRTDDGAGPYPSCELAFLTAPEFSQEAAAAALAAALGLGEGRRDGNAVRWESRLANGTETRLALSPATDLGGPATRLSISVSRLPPGFE